MGDEVDVTQYSSGGKKLILLKCCQRTLMIIEYCRYCRKPAEKGWDLHVKPGERWRALKVAPSRILTSNSGGSVRHPFTSLEPSVFQLSRPGWLG